MCYPKPGPGALLMPVRVSPLPVLVAVNKARDAMVEAERRRNLYATAVSYGARSPGEPARTVQTPLRWLAPQGGTTPVEGISDMTFDRAPESARYDQEHQEWVHADDYVDPAHRY